MKGLALNQETFFVIGILLISSIILVSSSALITGIELPFIDENHDIIDSERLQEEISLCIDSIESGVQVNECHIKNVVIKEDISRESLEDFAGDNVNIEMGEIANSTRTDILLKYNSVDRTVTVNKSSVCDPWGGDNCENNLNCICSTECVIGQEDIEEDQIDKYGCLDTDQ